MKYRCTGCECCISFLISRCICLSFLRSGYANDYATSPYMMALIVTDSHACNRGLLLQTRVPKTSFFPRLRAKVASYIISCNKNYSAITATTDQRLFLSFNTFGKCHCLKCLMDFVRYYRSFCLCPFFIRRIHDYQFFTLAMKLIQKKEKLDLTTCSILQCYRKTCQ